MYSAVLMLALTAGSETADFGRNRCSAGCAGYVSGCAATSCARGGHRLLGNRCGGGGLFGGHRCASSCASTVRTVCAGGHACSGGVACSRGGHGCSRGLFGGGLFNRGGRCSCPPACACTGTVVVPAKKSEEVKPPKTKKTTTQSSAPATIRVSLPAGARLLVDGTPTQSTAETRTLVTPSLDVGTTYVYTMRAEIVRDGQNVAQTQRVTVRGGETSTVNFEFPAQGVASR